MKSNKSAEDYLEAILMLGLKNPPVRSVDIAAELGFKKSSVSVAMKNLREKEHITMSKEGYITLTPSGKKIAEGVYEKHRVISKLLKSIGVNEETAVEDACKIEHVLSTESFDAIKRQASQKPCHD